MDIKQNRNHAIKYGHILQSGNASVTGTLSPRNRHHAMSALANLGEYQGCYDQILSIRQRYSLKGTSGNESIQTLQIFFFQEMTVDSMLSKVKEMIRVLPREMGDIVRFACITGF